MIGDMPEGEIAIAGQTTGLNAKGDTADNLRKGPNPLDHASPIDKP